MLLGGQSRPPEPSAVQRIMAGGGRAVGVADGHCGFIAKSLKRAGHPPLNGSRIGGAAQWAMAVGHAFVDFKGALDDSARRSGRRPAQRRDRARRQRLRRPILLKENKDVRCHQDWRQAVSRDG